MRLKLFVFPLLIWLAAKRRWHALATAVASTVVFVLGSWAVIEFKGMLGRHRQAARELPGTG